MENRIADYFASPLDRSLQPLLLAIERFDGPNGRRSSDMARGLRASMQSFLQECSLIAGPSAREAERSTKQLVDRTGWSRELLQEFHTQLQCIVPVEMGEVV